MTLSEEAAEALVAGYLGGRALPRSVHKAVVNAARARLIDGDVPILDSMLCRVIDRGADEYSAQNSGESPQSEGSRALWSNQQGGRNQAR
ncbi:MAG: hypothetical protein JWQ73_779 [Variovorax sp.]|nr:hypothetical protein [Variovorax sp.]